LPAHFANKPGDVPSCIAPALKSRHRRHNGTPGSSLLSHQGGKNEVVEIFFEKGVFAPARQKLLRSQPWAQSSEAQNIS